MHNWPSCMPITLSKDLSGSKFSGSLQFQDIILGTHIPQLRILVDVDTRRLPNKWPYGWLLPFGPNQLTSTKWPCKISSFFFLLLNFNSHIIHPFSTFSLIFNFFFFLFLLNFSTYCYTFSNFLPPFYLFIKNTTIYLNITFSLSIYLPLFFFLFLFPSSFTIFFSILFIVFSHTIGYFSLSFFFFSYLVDFIIFFFHYYFRLMNFCIIWNSTLN